MDVAASGSSDTVDGTDARAEVAMTDVDNTTGADHSAELQSTQYAHAPAAGAAVEGEDPSTASKDALDDQTATVSGMDTDSAEPDGSAAAEESSLGEHDVVATTDVGVSGVSDGPEVPATTDTGCAEPAVSADDVLVSDPPAAVLTEEPTSCAAVTAATDVAVVDWTAAPPEPGIEMKTEPMDSESGRSAVPTDTQTGPMDSELGQSAAQMDTGCEVKQESMEVGDSETVMDGMEVDAGAELGLRLPDAATMAAKLATLEEVGPELEPLLMHGAEALLQGMAAAIDRSAAPEVESEEDDEDEDDESSSEEESSSSDETSSSESSVEKVKKAREKPLPRDAQGRVKLPAAFEDDDEEDPGVIRSKNEVDQLPPVAPIEVTIDPTDTLIYLGQMTGIVDQQLIVIADKGSKALADDSIVCTGDRVPIGRVFETFGPVVQPLYAIRSDKPFDPKICTAGTALYYTPKHVTYLLPGQLRSKGSDASNFYDEEIPEEEQEFSDDEQEQAVRRQRKHGSDQPPGDGAGPSRGRGGRGGRGRGGRGGHFHADDGGRNQNQGRDDGGRNQNQGRDDGGRNQNQGRGGRGRHDGPAPRYWSGPSVPEDPYDGDYTRLERPSMLYDGGPTPPPFGGPASVPFGGSPGGGWPPPGGGSTTGGMSLLGPAPGQQSWPPSSSSSSGWAGPSGGPPRPHQSGPVFGGPIQSPPGQQQQQQGRGGGGNFGGMRRGFLGGPAGGQSGGRGRGMTKKQFMAQRDVVSNSSVVYQMPPFPPPQHQ